MADFIFGVVPHDPPGVRFPFDTVPGSKQLDNVALDFTINFIINKGFEEIVTRLFPVTGLGLETASTIFEGSPAGQGEEAAIHQQQQRDEQNREGRRVIAPPLPIPVEQADP